MVRQMVGLAAFVGFLALPPAAEADPWKDESGHQRGGPPTWVEQNGEPPDWARGKGVWDGHLKHRFDGPPPWAGRGRGYHDGRYGIGFYRYPQPYYDSYGPGRYGRYYAPSYPYWRTPHYGW